MVIEHTSSAIQRTKFIWGVFLSTIFTDEETEINDFEKPMQRSPANKGQSKS